MAKLLNKNSAKNKKTLNTKIRNFHEKDNARIITVIFDQPQYIKTMVLKPMNEVSKQFLVEQWKTLHNSHESYEQYALIIKLFAITLTLLTFAFSVSMLVTLFVLTTLWIQEGIWKTFQCRAASAIIAVEDKLALSEPEDTNDSTEPYLLYKQWQENRSSTAALVTEYVSNSLKPTVLYPYIPLMFIVIIC